jgi:Flp pilus assembly pilin Flp
MEYVVIAGVIIFAVIASLTDVGQSLVGFFTDAKNGMTR